MLYQLHRIFTNKVHEQMATFSEHERIWEEVFLERLRKTDEDLKMGLLSATA
jgi:hypothetical protein